MIRFNEVYETLNAKPGPQHWWPADDQFEVIVGAMLVQRTTWRNVELAIQRLKDAGMLQIEVLHRERVAAIQSRIKSAGFFRIKAARLKNLAAFIVGQGGITALSKRPTSELRSLLLQIDGVGPETADAILLYAFARPVVVVDAYLRRLASRLTASDEAVPDASLREWVATTIKGVSRLNAFHALVVEHGKSQCKKRPRCAQCKINALCQTGRAALDA
jgi:endonuclease-3 related protein